MLVKTRSGVMPFVNPHSVDAILIRGDHPYYRVFAVVRGVEVEIAEFLTGTDASNEARHLCRLVNRMGS